MKLTAVLAGTVVLAAPALAADRARVVATYADIAEAAYGDSLAAARELGPDKIRVNAICPSFIDTDITAGMMTPDKLAAIVASVPLGRAGHAEDVAGCVLFLASDLAGYVTGTELSIHGGSHIH